MSASSNPVASATGAGCHRLKPDRFQRATAKTVAARSSASSRIPLRPGDSGRTGGRGRERGAPAEGAVVGTVTVMVVGELPTVAGFGETEQLDSAGFPEQEKATVPDNPPRPPVLKLKIAGWPGATVTEVVEPEDVVKVKSSPVPVRAAVCGLSAILSEMLRLPVRVPPAVGLKVTEIVQLAPAFTVVPQVLVWEKSPLAEILEMVSERCPCWSAVTVCAMLLTPTNWAGKVSEEGAKLTSGPGREIVSVSVTVMISFEETDTVRWGRRGRRRARSRTTERNCLGEV